MIFFEIKKLMFLVLSVANGNGKVGKETYLEKYLPTLPTFGDRRDAFAVRFEWDANFGIPGAFYIRNFMNDEFFLVSVTLEDIPNHGSIHFVCNSWIYNFKTYKKDRIFFANNVSLKATQFECFVSDAFARLSSKFCSQILKDS